MTLDAASGGLAFRLDDEGGGYFIELASGRTDVTLRKWLLDHDPRQRHATPRYRTVQRGALARPPKRGETIPFRLLVVGPMIELSLQGQVVLSTLSAERWHGYLGVWAESGSVRVRSPRFAPMRRPRSS